jgi:hypothetical protein
VFLFSFTKKMLLLLLLTMLLLSIDGFLPVLWMNNSNTTTTAKIALRMCVCVLRMASNVTARMTNPLEAPWQRSSFLDRNATTTRACSTPTSTTTATLNGCM